MPFTGFWDRWRRKHRQQPATAPSPPNLRKTEKQREAAERQVAKELAAAVTNAGVQRRDDGSRSG